MSDLREPTANCSLCKLYVEAYPWDPATRRHTGDSLGSPIQCGFSADGEFTPDNWQCVTLNKLRGAAFDRGREVYSDDQNAMIVVIGPGMFVALGAYKHRGKTEVAMLIDGETARPLRLSDFEEARSRQQRYDYEPPEVSL